MGPFQENRLLFSAFCPEWTCTGTLASPRAGCPSAIRPPGLAVRRTPDSSVLTPPRHSGRACARRSPRSAPPRGRRRRDRLSTKLTSVGHFLHTVRSSSICGFLLLKNTGSLVKALHGGGGWGTEGERLRLSRKFDLAFIFRVPPGERPSSSHGARRVGFEAGALRSGPFDDCRGLPLGFQQSFAATSLISMHQTS